MFFLLILISITFSLFGFIIGIWANDFQKIQLIPKFIITPLTFLGGSFYSIDMLPEIWQKISYFNPIVYLISAFRWSFYEHSDISIIVSLMTIAGFLVLCLIAIYYIFKLGYKIKVWNWLPLKSSISFINTGWMFNSLLINLIEIIWLQLILT